MPPKFGLRVPTLTRCSAATLTASSATPTTSVPVSANAELGAVLFRTSAGATSYAIDAKGTASLVGVDGFTVTGDLAARVNTHWRCCR
ncbi:MAG UNVERIFIED_CONTAM: hypothetical protein LVR18_47535 [Planctomycetaceae bacterium]